VIHQDAAARGGGRAKASASWLNAIAKVGGTGLSFVLFVVMARTMTPVAFADLSVALAWLALATALAGLSLPLVLVRFVAAEMAEGRYALARGVLLYSLGLSTSCSLGLGILVLAGAGLGWLRLPRELNDCIPVGVLLLVTGVALQVLTGFLQGVKRVVAAEILSNSIRPVLMLAALVTYWSSTGSSLSTLVVLKLYLAASCAVVLACGAYCYAVWPAALRSVVAQYHSREWFRTALAFMAVLVTSALSERIDLLVMGLGTSGEEIAKYAVAIRFGQTVIFAANAVSAVLAPHLVEQAANVRAGNPVPAQILVRGTARTTVAIAGIALVGFAVLALPFLKILAPHYAGAYGPLVVLAAGQVISACFGPAILVATLLDESWVAVQSLVVGIVVNASLNVLLVPHFGAIGAASATAFGMLCAALNAWRAVRRRLKVDTSVWSSAPIVSDW
jgi:O-antigen/teichoic acid export membrane protein